MIQLIRGFRDILPGEAELWQFVERTAISLFEDFGYQEIRIPVMEKTELFARSIGEVTDIVEKEMYTFPDRKKDLITLRPEATASIVRAYIQHKLYAVEPIQKLYTIGPMFRRERPQKGRYRQFYQIDAEVFGVAEPQVDIQLIHMLQILCERLGVTDTKVHLNSLGCPQCRPAFKEALSGLLDASVDQLCANCQRRKDKNPLRVLDCKVPKCREAMASAPAITDHLCPACREHFAAVTGALTDLKVPYVLDKRLVRGLDYYTRTIFEIQTGALGAQSAVAGGGRYDMLVENLGGPAIPAIGFAIGFDRLAEIVAQGGRDFRRTPDLYIAALGDEAKERGFQWSLELGLDGILCEMGYDQKSLKSQMKRANRMGAAHVLIVGESELEKGAAVLRNMQTKKQVELPVAGLIKALKETIKS